MNAGERARVVLDYWRASRRLLRGDTRMRLSASAADIVLINHVLDDAWPRLQRAATSALVLARDTTATPTSCDRSKSPARRPRHPRD